MSLTPDLSDAASIPEDVVVRRMVALFDYDPWESSPNVDSEVSATLTPFYIFNHFLQILSYYCFKYNKVVCGDVSRLFFCLSKVELGFRSGDIIYVLGDMDQDGFYYVSVSTMIDT